jgi:hypothetical protein
MKHYHNAFIKAQRKRPTRRSHNQAETIHLPDPENMPWTTSDGDKHFEPTHTEKRQQERSAWQGLHKSLIEAVVTMKTISGKRCCHIDCEESAFAMCESCATRPVFCSSHAARHFQTSQECIVVDKNGEQLLNPEGPLILVSCSIL